MNFEASLYQAKVGVLERQLAEARAERELYETNFKNAAQALGACERELALVNAALAKALTVQPEHDRFWPSAENLAAEGMSVGFFARLHDRVKALEAANHQGDASMDYGTPAKGAER